MVSRGTRRPDRAARRKPVAVEILGPILLDAQYGDARASTLKGESPATSPEAQTSLIEGKKLRRTRLKLERDGVEWVLTLDGETFNFTGWPSPTPAGCRSRTC